MTVDLDGEQPDDGEANERDTVGTDVEGVIGGSGDDVITGSAGDDSLYGGDGDDRIVDTGGEDLLDGADGDDVLLAADGEADSVECGLGEDEVEFDEIDELSDECEVPSDPDADTDRDADADTVDDACRSGGRWHPAAAGPRRPRRPDRDSARRLPRPRPHDARPRRHGHAHLRRDLPRLVRAEGGHGHRPLAGAPPCRGRARRDGARLAAPQWPADPALDR